MFNISLVQRCYRAPVCPLLWLVLFIAACANPPETMNGWTPFQQGLPTHSTILTLASEPDHPHIVFAGAYDRVGAYLSRDHARTWSPANAGLDPAPVYALQFIGKQLYAGTASGLYRWHATRWERVDAIPSATVYAITRGADGTTYVVTDARGIYASRDMHLWTRLRWLDDVIPLSLVALDVNTLIVGTSGHGAYITRDGGTTWHALEAFRGDYVSLVTSHPRERRVYLRTRRGLFHSSDAGATWQPLHGGIAPAIVNALVFDAFSPRVYAGTTAGLFVSHDAGAAWQPLATFDAPILALVQSDAQTWLAGTPRGIYRSHDAGHTWELANTGLGKPELHALAQHPQTGTLFIASEYGLYRATPNHAETFERIGGEVLRLPILAIALDPHDPQTMFVGTYRRGIFISRDGGATWDAAGGLFRGRLSPKGLVASTEGVFARVLFERVYKSEDAGATWRAVWTGMPHEVEVHSLSVVPQDATQMYAGTTNGVYYSRNAGESWEWRGLEGITIFAIWIAPHQSQTLWVGATDGVYHTDDGGHHWRRGTLRHSVTALVRDAAGTFYAGTKYAGVWYSRDEGQTWQRLPGLDASVIALHSDTARGTLYALTAHGLYRMRLK